MGVAAVLALEGDGVPEALERFVRDRQGGVGGEQRAPLGAGRVGAAEHLVRDLAEIRVVHQVAQVGAEAGLGGREAGGQDGLG